MLISAPESTTGVSFSKSRVCFKHPFRAIWLQHNLCNLYRVLFRDVYRDVYVASAEAEVAELKPESFEIPECLGAGVDMGLLLEAVVVAFGFEHHGHPVVSCVMRWLFMATANYVYHIIFFSCRTFRGQANACRVRQKQISLIWRKRDATFHPRVLRCCFRPRGIPSRN